MPIIPNQSEAQQLLAQLQLAYPTPHVDSPEEQRENLVVLEQLLKDGARPESLVAKIRAIHQSHGPRLRYKLTTLIVGAFWNQRVENHIIAAKGYEVPAPRQVKDFRLDP